MDGNAWMEAKDVTKEPMVGSVVRRLALWRRRASNWGQRAAAPGRITPVEATARAESSGDALEEKQSLLRIGCTKR